MSTASWMASMPAATCAISRSSGPRTAATMQNSVAPVSAVCLAASTSDRDVEPGRAHRRVEQARLGAEVAVLGAAAGLERDDALDLDLGPHHLIRTSCASSSSSSSASSGSRSTSSTCVLGQAVALLEHLGAGDVEDLDTASSSRLGSRATCQPSVERRPVRDARDWRTRPGSSASPRPSAIAPEQRHARHRGQVDEVAAVGEVGLGGPAPTTTPGAASARDGAARATVSAVWLSVPSPAAATTSTGAASSAARSASVQPSVVERDEQPARALDEHEVVLGGELQRGGGRGLGDGRARAARARAAWCGASGSG